jgi:hypothetical protein
MMIRNLFYKIKEACRAPTLTEVIHEELKQATVERMQAMQVIKNHRFLEHMARAKINALDSWNKQTLVDKYLGGLND